MLRSSVLTGLVASAAGIQSSIQGSIRTRAGTQGVQFDKEHPLDWDTLNATRGFCGLDKCYFPSRLGEHDTRPLTGYLVANPHQQKRVLVWVGQWSTWQHEAFAQWNRTWTFAKDLQDRFGVKHTLLGPPHLATLPEEHATRLNYNLTYFPAAFNRRVRGGPSVPYPPPYAPGKEVTVQAVRACPWPACIIVGCDMGKLSR